MRRDLVANQIVEQAAELFARRGFSGTSLQEDAEALQIQRTALYHYISSKQDLLTKLVEGLTRVTAQSLTVLAADQTKAPADKLREAIKGMALRVGSNPARFRLLLLSEGELEGALAKEHQGARRETLEALASILQEGIKSGAFRPVDARLAAFSILGMCNWVAWWYRPDRDANETPELIAEFMADIAMSGLRTPERRGTKDGTNLDQAIAQLHRDLAYLERSVRNGVGPDAVVAMQASRRRTRT